MLLCSARQFGALVALCCSFGSAVQAQSLVDLTWEPALQTVIEGDELELRLIATSDGFLHQDFAALDAILDWDPAYLELLVADDTGAGYTWFHSGFLPDPDGINADTTDGDALYTALSTPSTPATAFVPPGLLVTTMRFKALQPTAGTTVSFTPAMGTFGLTRVLDFFTPAFEITGDITSVATVVIEPAPIFYCTTSPNSNDIDGSQIFVSGSSSQSAPQPSLSLHAEFQPAQYGVFFYGPAQQQTPFGNGFLCVLGPFVRLNPVQISVGRVADRDVDVSTIPLGTNNFQFWFRDPFGGGDKFNLTDAVAVTIIP